METTYDDMAGNKNHLCWASIWGGLFTAASIGILFSLLSASIGFALFKVDGGVITAISVGGLAAYIIFGTVAMFLGGWITGVFAKTNCTYKGSLHGLIMWALATILGVTFVASGVGALLPGAGQLIGKVTEVSAQTAGQVLPAMGDKLADNQENIINNITDQANKLMGTKANKKDVNATVDHILNASDEDKQQFTDALTDYLMNPNDQNANNVRDTIKHQLVKNGNMSEQQADEVINKWQDQYQQAMQKAKDKATEAAEKASDIMSSIALGAFLTLLIGAIATTGAAALATRRRVRMQDNNRHVSL